VGPEGGALSILYHFDSGNSASPNTNGVIRFDRGAAGSIQTVYMSTTDINGIDWTLGIQTMSASTSTTKGYLRVAKRNDTSNFVFWRFLSFTGTPTAGAMATLNIDKPSEFNGNLFLSSQAFNQNDIVVMSFTQNGDAGSTTGLTSYTPTLGTFFQYANGTARNGLIMSAAYTRMGTFYNVYVAFSWSGATPNSWKFTNGVSGANNGLLQVGLPAAVNAASPRVACSIGQLYGLSPSFEVMCAADAGNAYVSFYNFNGGASTPPVFCSGTTSTQSLQDTGGITFFISYSP
jgi:hypothetical protein